MRAITHREYLLWMARRTQQWNTVSKDNYYAMRIAQAVVQAAVKDPGKIKLEDFRVEFDFSTREVTAVELDEDGNPLLDKPSWIPAGYELPPVVTKSMIDEVNSQIALSRLGVKLDGHGN